MRTRLLNTAGLAFVALSLVVGPVALAQDRNAPKQEDCETLFSDEVQAAFRDVASQASSRDVRELDELELQPLRAALEKSATSIRERGLLVVADLRHCKFFTTNNGAGKTCPGSANLLNTGLENHHPDDPDRDIGRWHQAPAFISVTIVHPQASREDAPPSERSELRCWVILS